MHRAIVLLIINCSFSIGILAQQCIPIGIFLGSQNSVDSFSINYPDLYDLDVSLTICGNDIVNLHGLQQIRSINNYLYLTRTSITNFEGLNNLNAINQSFRILENSNLKNMHGLEQLEIVRQNLVFYGNNALESLEGLNALDFDNLTGTVVISNNESLEHCHLEDFCDFLVEYNKYSIEYNKEGCMSWNEIVGQCELPVDTAGRVECYYDSFEDWNSEGEPDNWGVEIILHNGEPNIERVDALTEGDHALLLRSNTPFFEGNLNTRVVHDLDDPNDLIDISFKYKCLGEGWCNVNVWEMGVNGRFQRTIWSFSAGDTSLHEVYLPNIKLDSNFNFIESIELEASPIWTAVGSYGVSEFIVDELRVSKKDELNSSREIVRSDFMIFPNPVSDVLNIPHDWEPVSIFNMEGKQQTLGLINGQVNVEAFKDGVYILIARHNHSNELASTKFVKY